MTLSQLFWTLVPYLTGAALVLIPSILVVLACYLGAIRQGNHEGNSRPAADIPQPLVAGRAALDGLVAANDREAA